jgi:hypothetical protein
MYITFSKKLNGQKNLMYEKALVYIMLNHSFRVLGDIERGFGGGRAPVFFT